MNKDELKNKIMGIISTVLLSKVMKEKYILKDGDIERIADALISAGIRDEKAEIQNQEKFAKDHGFTPDCTPYYIAEKCLERLHDTIGQVNNYKKLWKDARATCKKRNVTEKKRLNLYRVVVNKSPTYDEVEEYICAAKSEENARLLSEYCQGDVNKPKEDFEVQHIGLSDNDSLEEIICEVVNWF